MTTRHAAVWIDHSEAKVFHVDDERFDPKVVQPRHHLKRHNITTAEHDHPADAEHFFHEVAQALTDVTEILVVGPGSAKLELIKHVHKHDHGLVPKSWAWRPSITRPTASSSPSHTVTSTPRTGSAAQSRDLPSGRGVYASSTLRSLAIAAGSARTRRRVPASSYSSVTTRAFSYTSPSSACRA